MPKVKPNLRTLAVIVLRLARAEGMERADQPLLLEDDDADPSADPAIERAGLDGGISRCSQRDETGRGQSAGGCTSKPIRSPYSSAFAIPLATPSRHIPRVAYHRFRDLR